MKARLLTGVDALASCDATSNPEPLITRVQATAVLPNDVKANLSGCFVIGNATGSLAKERVEVQFALENRRVYVGCEINPHMATKAEACFAALA